MVFLTKIFSFLLVSSTAFAVPSLFENEQLGAILGTTFGGPGANATFDYVVVGGGTAGLTVATRLAEDPTLSIAVIEAGGFYEVDDGNLSVIPGQATQFVGAEPKYFQPLVDWDFVTTPQKGAKSQSTFYPRGKTLGGSSARNYMFYHRGTKGSYQKWADEVGDQSYNFENFSPYFQKSCRYSPPNQALYQNSSNKQDLAAFSPTGGPLQVSSGNYADPFGTWCQRCFVALGLEQIDGFQSGSLLGSAYGSFTIDPNNAHRSSAESSFLQKAVQNGTTLRVYKNTLAQRILFSSNRTATGVAVITAGAYGGSSVKYTLSARKEVIVSAGAFQSPQLLMVSGVGPRHTLQKLNISCIQDLAGVGQNMWDHIRFGVVHRVNVPTASALLNDPDFATKAAQLFLKSATGPLSIFGPGYYGWEKLPEPYRSALSNDTRSVLNESFPPDWPEIEWLPANSYLGYRSQADDPRDGSNYAMLTTALVAPLSRGSVSIQGTDMSTPPLIDPNSLTAKADIELAIQAVQRQRQAWKLLKDYGLAIGDEVLPGANVTTPAEILNFVASIYTPVYHAAATCKMGRKNDPLAVIDSAARVFGTRGLRVVDASSFPLLPPGHPQATVYALAEKIADLILRGN